MRELSTSAQWCITLKLVLDDLTRYPQSEITITIIVARLDLISDYDYSPLMLATEN